MTTCNGFEAGAGKCLAADTDPTADGWTARTARFGDAADNCPVSSSDAAAIGTCAVAITRTGAGGENRRGRLNMYLQGIFSARIRG